MADGTFSRSSQTGRIHRKDPFWNGKKRHFGMATAMSFLTVQLLFLGVMSYLYGSLFRSGERVHNFRVLFVDYDGGVIGQSFREAALSLSGPSFPAVHECNASDYPTAEDVYQSVWKGDYWAALSVSAGASTRLAQAIHGIGSESYNASNVVSYVWNSARYPSASEGFIYANLQTWTNVARLVYNKLDGSNAVASLPSGNANAASVLLNPWEALAVDIMPTNQNTKFFLNTISMVLPIIMQFFFLMAINGISSTFRLFTFLPASDNMVIRAVLSASFTLVGGLCQTAYIWAFREDWAVNGGQFVLTWMILWLWQHINFTVLDVATAFIPQRFISFFVLPWAILNVTSTIFPFEMNPGFYHWGYTLPAHECYQVLIQIWSAGADNQLHIALPVLFAWEIVMIPLAVAAVFHRCAVGRQEQIRAIRDAEKPQATTSGLSGPAKVKTQLERNKDHQQPQYSPSNDSYFPSMAPPVAAGGAT